MIVGSATTHADILALYDFESPSTTLVAGQNQTASSQFPLPGQTSGVSASVYNTNSLTMANATNIGGVATGSNDPHAFARTVTTPTHSDLATNPTFHEFSLAVNQGIWSFDSLHFEYWVNDASGNQSFSVTIYSDLTGYNLGDELGAVVYAPTGSNIPDIQTVTINDNNFRSAFQHLTAGTTVDFRLVFSDNISDRTVVHRIDDVVVRGFEVEQVTVSMPEPSAGTIFMLIGATAATRRRRSETLN